MSVLKGSDGVAVEAIAKGAIPKAQQRMQQALDVILPFVKQIDIITASGDMGGSLCRQMGFFDSRCIYRVRNYLN